MLPFHTDSCSEALGKEMENARVCLGTTQMTHPDFQQQGMETLSQDRRGLWTSFFLHLVCAPYIFILMWDLKIFLKKAGDNL
jgi:hypothetical protein